MNSRISACYQQNLEHVINNIKIENGNFYFQHPFLYDRVRQKNFVKFSVDRSQYFLERIFHPEFGTGVHTGF